MQFDICRVHSPTNALFYFKKHIKIYIKIHINIAPTCFGLQPSSREPALNLAKVIFIYLHAVHSAQHATFHNMLPHNRIINNNVISPNVLT